MMWVVVAQQIEFSVFSRILHLLVRENENFNDRVRISVY
jgi:hypothetical protein